MGENTGISWAHNTYNHWYGCAKVSAACRDCYAEDFVTKRLKLPVWGVKAERQLSSAKNRKEPYAWNRKAIKEGKKTTVFCSSLSDVFEDREDLVSYRHDLFRMIEDTSEGLIWLLLTKRAHRMKDLAVEAGWTGDWPENVWAGVTVEDLASANGRIPHLLAAPVTGKRFVSMEPLLEYVDLTSLFCPPFLDGEGTSWLNALNGITYESNGDYGHSVANIDWVIVGGESGATARPFELEWAEELKNQVEGSNRRGAKFFFKQMGSNPLYRGEKYPMSDKKGKIMDEWPASLRVMDIPAYLSVDL